MKGEEKKERRGKEGGEEKEREKKFHSRARTRDRLQLPPEVELHAKPTYIANLDCHELRVASLALPIVFFKLFSRFTCSRCCDSLPFLFHFTTVVCSGTHSQSISG